MARSYFAIRKAPLEFIEQTRVEYGPIFTVLTVGKRLTFVTEVDDFKIFFGSKDVDFQQAVQDPVEHTASITKHSFYKHHTEIHDMMKRRLALSNLHLFIGNLSEEFTERLTYLGTEGTDDLCDLVRHSMYSAVVNQLFGRGICITDGNAVREFEDHFKIFDKGFEYGKILKVKMSIQYQFMFHIFQTLLQHLLDIVDGKFGPNYVLLMLWASQANALPVSTYRTFIPEVIILVGTFLKQDLPLVSETDLRKLPYLKWCILEAIRLRSPGAIARKVVRPLKIKNYIVPPGDILMLSLFWAHRNPKYFPEPEKFLPERWKEADLEKHVFLNGFIGFGGGRYQCPGRWFALMEIQLFIALILYKYEFTLLDSVPKQSPLHLVGTQQPMGPCRVRYRSR
uniref:Cytochrome P450, family 39, subfamily A, polypeptide 1 n=1 Tax=Callorhinchus milii TaxID=7868 RepID=A0A4W3I9B8_CALMI